MHLKHLSLLMFGSLLACADFGTKTKEGDDPGECTDAADNDNDGDFDCSDAGCAGSSACPGTEGDVDTDADSDADSDTDTDTDTDTDADSDGYTVDEGDCDDTNPAINPSASDVLGDLIDQNCDGRDGTDLDGDGDPSEASGGTDCDDADPTVDGLDEDADRYTSCSGDCDDTDPEVRPHQYDDCDGRDNNCNGETDDGFGDGYSSCGPEVGGAWTSSDCYYDADRGGIVTVFPVDDPDQDLGGGYAEGDGAWFVRSEMGSTQSYRTEIPLDAPASYPGDLDLLFEIDGPPSGATVFGGDFLLVDSAGNESLSYFALDCWL